MGEVGEDHEIWSTIDHFELVCPDMDICLVDYVTWLMVSRLCSCIHEARAT